MSLAYTGNTVTIEKHSYPRRRIFINLYLRTYLQEEWGSFN